MPFPQVHLVIADTILKKQPHINREKFFLGSIAPDAVHSSPNFSGELKKHTHICAPHEIWGFIQDLDGWQALVLNFFEEHKNYPGLEHYVAGYTAHILTDIYWSRKIYSKFLRDYPEEAKKIWQSPFHKDCAEADKYLYSDYFHHCDFWDNLKKADTFSFEDKVKKDEMDKTIHRIVCEQFTDVRKDTGHSFRFISPQTILNFIDEAAECISSLIF